MGPNRSTTVLTLVVLVVLVVIGAAWGWQAATAPLPELGAGSQPEQVCRERTYPKGTTLSARNFVVSVYNAGSESGLAGSTMEALVTEQNFGRGEVGNVPAGTDASVTHAQVWTLHPGRPGPRLVASRLAKGGAPIVEREGLGPGVTVVVGNQFQGLRKGKARITTHRELTVCSPVPTDASTPAGSGG